MKQFKVILISIFFFGATGCTTIESGVKAVSQTIKDVSKNYAENRKKKESEVTPVPFERVANRSTQTGLVGKNLVFNARYAGTEPNPKRSPGVSGHVNIKLCALKTSTCSDMFVISNRKADLVYNLNHNQQIAVTAKIVNSTSSATNVTGIHIDPALSPSRRYVVIKDVSTNLHTASTQAKVNIDVLGIQKELTRRGYNPGPQDGVWGGKTRQALMQFQYDAGLVESGEVDVETLRALGLE